MSYWYLATPYGRYPDGLDAAHKIACSNAALLIRAGIDVFCPIAHTHSIALHGDIPVLDHGFWMSVDRPFMDLAKGIIMLQMKSWEISKGMAYEQEVFTEAGKPIVWMQPGVIPDEFCIPLETFSNE